jgi:hypothetical protein
VSVEVSKHEFPSYWKWDFNNGELLETFYLRLDNIPKELFGKVPLYIYLDIDLANPKFYENPNFLISYELTAYDVYPP